MDAENPYGSFKLLYMMSQMIGILLIFAMAHWLKDSMGGFAWRSDPAKEFNWHPLFITVGMIVLHGQSILIYRGYRELSKTRLKIAHIILLTIEFICIIIALITAFDSHNLAEPPKPNLYSLHSWIGLINVILFCIQFLVGFIVFLLPVLGIETKSTIMPYHRYFGGLILFIGISVSLMGLTEKALWAIKDYSEFPQAGLWLNVIGVLMVTYGSLIGYLLTQTEYKRLSLLTD